MKQYIPQDLYNQILKNIPIGCVDIAIIFKGKILLIKRKDSPAKGQWWLPGGRVLKGEMMKNTALRKAREEVGIQCHAGPIICTAETIFPDGPYKIPVHSINSCFLVYPVNENITVKIDPTHSSDYKWVDSIPENIHPYIKKCLIGAGLQ
ncbi:MAG: NUDIX domain-containing protein [Candidatus Aureabacteria bacterium]|nr:NUDIX domain-containing protein [Candidatus Auribacterota bacterium]